MSLNKTFLLFVGLSLIASNALAGTVKGIVKYDGEAPKFREIKMDADPVCLTHHKGPVYPQTLVLGEGNTMGNVFLHIKSGLPKTAYPPPAEPMVLDQKGCEYTPHVGALMVGQTMRILNPDGTLHNVNSTSKINPPFNIAMPKFRTEITRVFDKPEFMFQMKCDVHPWMGAWISVMEHPYFTTTAPDGLFQIADLPPGNYELEAWHERLGTKSFKFTISADETVETEFVFSRPASGSN